MSLYDRAFTWGSGLCCQARGAVGGPAYSSYDQAVQASSRYGYENEAIIDTVVEKTRRYRDRLASPDRRVLFSQNEAYGLAALGRVSASHTGELTVIDPGGAAGAHYFLARSFFPTQRKIRWMVVETESMAAAAAREFTTPELSFHTDLAAARASVDHVDLIHCSGTIQCVRDPHGFLDEIIRAQPASLFFNRLGLSEEDKDVIAVHHSMLSWNGPGALPSTIRDKRVCYPFVFPERKRFMQAIQREYRIIFEFPDFSGIFPVRRTKLSGLGFIADRSGS